MTTKKLVFTAAFLALATLASQARAAMTILGIPSNEKYERSYKYDRFYTQPDEESPAKAFIGEAFDWSGVGVAWQGSGSEYRTRWVTMISPEYFLTARHAYPPVGGDVTFHEGNSLDGPSHTYTIDTMIGNVGDLSLGKLTTPIDPADNITYYPILDFNKGLNYDNFIGLTLFAYGHGGTHPSIDNTDEYYNPRVGKNRIDGYESRNMGYGSVLNIVYDYDTSNGLGLDECLLEIGDSGGPSFVAFNGELALVGIHSYTVEVNDEEYSGDSFAPRYINNIIAWGAPIETVTPLGGDANLDGIVNDIDATILAINWHQSFDLPAWENGDFDGNGTVNSIDARMLAENWMQSVETTIPSMSFAAVPEPTTAVLLLMGTLSLLALHFRRRA